MLQQRLPMLAVRLKVAIDILHHDDSGVDDDTEVNRTERQQVGVLTLQHQDDDEKEQGERNIRANDDRASQVTQKYQLNDKDQETAEDQIMQHRMGGDPDQ